MSRYIDVNALLAEHAQNVEVWCGYEYSDVPLVFVEDIENFPTADVVEVRHSHWVVCGSFDDFLKCSSCGYDRPWQTAIEHKYCPNCGAKMDGERSTKDVT